MLTSMFTSVRSHLSPLFPLLASAWVSSFTPTVAAASNEYLKSTLPTNQRVAALLAEMTLEEKIGQMSQFVGEAVKEEINTQDTVLDYTLALGELADWVRQGKTGSFLKVATYEEANILQKLALESRLKIPLLIATDALHGHGMYKGAPTIYATQIGLAASFDPDLAQRIAQYTAVEMRATGYHWAFSPNIEVVRDARWGRFGETFGEDPHLVTEMGNAMVRGYQGKDFSQADNVIATAKHFVAGGIAYNGVNGAPADVSERSLHEIFFPPFIGAINNNVYTIMPAHTDLNGVPCHAHGEYLTALLREQWGFEGFYISDWKDIARLQSAHRIVATEKQAAEVAVNAGIDMNMHGPQFYNDLLALVKEGAISESRIDKAVSKILFAKFQLGLFENRIVKKAEIETVLRNPTHLQTALESAQKSLVLLKNNHNTLPINTSVKRLFVTGPSANNQTILGEWAQLQAADNVTTVLEGFQALVTESKANKAPPSFDIDYLATPGYQEYSQDTLKKAAQKAQQADIAVVVVGENSLRFDKTKTSGENLDRANLDLVGDQLKLLQTIKATGTPLVVVLINGGPIASEWLYENADAIIEAWEPGMLGGKAIAQAIVGEYNPGGKLPITIPRSAGHVQSFYNHKPSAFHRGGFYNSQRTPLYEFGHGLSYTQFEYSHLRVPAHLSSTDALSITVKVKNTGNRNGDDVVLIYLNDKVSSVTTPVKKLVAFKRIHLKAGETQQVSFTLNSHHLALYNAKMVPVIEPGDFDIMVGNKGPRATFSYRARAH